METRAYQFLTILIAFLSCAAGWLAIPEFRTVLVAGITPSSQKEVVVAPVSPLPVDSQEVSVNARMTLSNRKKTGTTPQSPLSDDANGIAAGHPGTEMRAESGQPDGPAWIVCAGAYSDRAVAEAQAQSLTAMKFSAGVLWIPDFGSLSGAELWLAYVGPIDYSDRSGAKQVLAQVRTSIPKAYALKLDGKGPREELR